VQTGLVFFALRRWAQSHAFAVVNSDIIFRQK
jgi:hypothetical protein